MKTKSEQISEKSGEKGNALIYVLIAIALFAGLSFALSRQSNQAPTAPIDDANAEIYANQMISYAAQAKNTIDQMLLTGSSLDDLDFTLPSETGFNTAPHMHKVFHPQGGGLSPANIPEPAKQEASTVPVSGWYIGMFNNVGWTKTAANDVILAAYQINQKVCAALNEKITGSTDIPAINGEMRNYFTPRSTNPDLTPAACAACEGHLSLCVRNSPTTTYTFYNVIAAR